MERIFVSIASYRDPQTIPTIIDLLEKAENKDAITIGVCLQHEKNELSLPKYHNIKIIDYNWRESQGACWARYNIQKFLYDGEDYYFQLDSHHRFCEKWDMILVGLIKKLKQKCNKPIIGGYCPGYNPADDKTLEYKPMQINSFPDFTSSGDLMFMPKLIKNFETLSKNNELAIPARFLSGHFIFADRSFCEDCIYDPNIYFRGEELSLSARAYTSGYDMFHPTIPIVWHEYTRKNQPKHWNDHTTKNGFVVDGNSRAEKGKERVRFLLGMEKNNHIKFGKYGLGNHRSLHEYELYAGVCFVTKQVHKYTYNVNNIYDPPKILSEEEWESGLMKKYNISCTISQKFIDILKQRLDVQDVTLSFRNIHNKLCYSQKIKKPNLDLIQEKYYIECSMESYPTTGSISAHNESGKLIQQTQLSNIKI